ncbi:DUF1656 domain-containing protein [Sphingomonas sanguinis]|jgi:hypothetical protein|uniref:DUF1656 domain-containing protein n=1 Tax=Sphingomonas sp. LC-1 TaxID=3110957 RepID=UPI0021BB523F|nr:DUF1656 domain-containing protein [Sphingomonas sp. LC-1]MCT8003398.1 DUF1656 domain-containing protein [Sphingomonas sp. LC-1]
MTGDLDLLGVFVHPLLIAAFLAFVGAELIGWALAKARLYRFVWHRGLFDVALTVILWAGIAGLLTGGNPASAFFG